MDSYSVKEAATVLGVPVGRVWELLARGVIAGAQEAGSGMRVYLRGTPAAVPAPVPFAEPAASGAGMGGAEAQKGRRNGGHDGRDASPFRELLTEFRNLTERYGQALLALGEARGEVAGLRTRVELLEARLDLRLPGPPAWTTDEPAPRPPAPTTSPEQAAAEEPRDVSAEIQPVEETEDVSAEIQPVEETEDVSAEIQAAFAETPEVTQAGGQPVVEPVEPVAAEPVEPEAAEPVPEPEAAEPVPEPEAAPSDALEPAAERRPPRRRRGSRSAVSGIAAALARADDPTVAGLPGGDEAAEALAALRRDLVAADAAAEAIAEPEPEPALEPVSKPTPEGASTSRVDELAAFDAVAPVPELPEPGPAPFAPEPEVVTEAEAEPAVGGEVLAAPPSTEADAEAAPSVYSSEWDEPDWIAEEDLEQGWQPAADQVVETDREVADRAAPEAEPVTQAVADIETVSEPTAEEPTAEEPTAEEPTAEEAEPEEADVASMAHWPLPTEDFEPAAEPAEVAEQPRLAEPESEPPEEPASIAGQAPVPEPAAAPEPPVEPEQVESDAFEEELMWLGDEFRPSTTAWQPLGTGQREAPGRHEAPAPSTPPIEEVALERLARQRGWDATELSAIRSLLGDRAPTPSPAEPEPAGPQEPMSLSPASRADESSAASEADAWEHAPAAWLPPVAARPALELPGGVELDEAMAALGAAETPAEVQVEEPSASTPRAWSKAGDATPVAGPAIEPVAEEPSPERGEGEAVAELAAEPAGEMPAPAPPASSPSAIDERHETVASAEEPSGTAGTTHEPPAPTPASSPAVRPLPPRPVDQAWLRGRRGPAANAYRRLRRLFPG